MFERSDRFSEDLHMRTHFNCVLILMVAFTAGCGGASSESPSEPSIQRTQNGGTDNSNVSGVGPDQTPSVNQTAKREQNSAASRSPLLVTEPLAINDTPAFEAITPAPFSPDVSTQPLVELSNRKEDAAKARQFIAVLVSPETSEADWEASHTTLLAMGRSAVPTLSEVVLEGDAVERELAATTLALLGGQSEEAAPALVKALNDSSYYVRANAASALVQIPGHASQAGEVLIELLTSSDPQLRQMVAMNLGALGPEAAGHVADLADRLTQETEPDVLVPVVQLLGRIGPAAGPAVSRLSRLAAEQPGEVAEAASEAIQLISGESISPQ